ncbi:hypothetical protein BT96DRAFT_949846 [Gymnopus androsaceus JB14]|uniref:Uncharacterized protein n=1 Tax=Gymnopus androsaceus JB14 TaxID=1447944 RepID=A0A6A4GJ81_9AGAR|nr:hypothetical protein BT96DRAFT_949846 [Gymnopus androsaceus JB14]
MSEVALTLMGLISMRKPPKSPQGNGFGIYDSLEKNGPVGLRPINPFPKPDLGAENRGRCTAPKATDPDSRPINPLPKRAKTSGPGAYDDILEFRSLSTSLQKFKVMIKDFGKANSQVPRSFNRS